MKAKKVIFHSQANIKFSQIMVRSGLLQMVTSIPYFLYNVWADYKHVWFQIMNIIFGWIW